MLAAGSSSRLGHNKLNFVFQGKTMLQRTIDAALKSNASQLMLVLGSNHQSPKYSFSGDNTQLTINEDWEKGIGSSIKCGIKKLLDKHPDLSAIIISVCDQPYLSHAIFDALIDTYLDTEKKIIASTYNGITGVPVLYDKDFFNELLTIPDEYGARRHIVEQAGKDILESIPFPKGEIDIDTIDDIKSLPGH